MKKHNINKSLLSLDCTKYVQGGISNFFYGVLRE